MELTRNMLEHKTLGGNKWTLIKKQFSIFFAHSLNELFAKYLTLTTLKQKKMRVEPPPLTEW